jgi:short-subunit dehydrogenase
MAGRLAGKVALITGASAGIGYAAALALANEGADLVITARREERLEQLAAAAKARGVRARLVVGDASDELTAIECVKTACELGRLEILINNVGVGNYKSLADTSAAEYDEMMNANMRSTFLFARHTAPVMVQQGTGTIVMISSMAGKYGFANQAVYCATKFAQVGFAQSLDKELRPHGIKVGVVCPGGVKTEFAIGKGRTEAGVAASGMLDADDVAAAIVFACSQGEKSRIIEVQMRTMDEALS